MASLPIAGVFAAAITPLSKKGVPDLSTFPQYLAFLGHRGCHGALILGTTGEGPSFSPTERMQICRAALAVRQEIPDFQLLAGTGTPSLTETAELTKAIFDLGYDGVVVLPPYYFRKVEENGLYRWYHNLLKHAVPKDGMFLGYHIPQITGVPLTIDLIARLLDAHPESFRGIKDSSGDAEHARQLGERFGQNLAVFTGNDRLLSLALQHQAAGCITALANLVSPLHRKIWDAHQNGKADPVTQDQLSAIREITDRHPPFPPLIKFILTHHHAYPQWGIRPPLLSLTASQEKAISAELNTILSSF